MSSLSVSDWSAALGGIAFLISLFLMWRNRAGETPKFSNGATIVAFSIMCLLGGGALILRGVLEGQPTEALLAAVLIGIIAGSWLVGKTVHQVKWASCSSLILFSSVYLVSVGLQVRANHQEMLAGPYIQHEAKEIRRLAGLT